MAAILRDSMAVVRTCLRAMPLAMITMRKSIHGFPSFSYIGMGRRLAVLRAAEAPLLTNSNLHSYAPSNDLSGLRDQHMHADCMALLHMTRCFQSSVFTFSLR